MDTIGFELDTDNREQQLAYELISKTNKCVFITGKAGTGKTTFIKRIQQEIPKNFLVLAPTGIAALTVGGQTIHSFFGLPMHIISPSTKIQVSNMRDNVLNHIDAIIIDEVSMVRCDMVDAIDRYLRLKFQNNLPFGGIQVIFVGDLYQLPPVVKKGSVDDEMMVDLYGDGTPYFYKAKALRRIELSKIEFQKIYRQQDSNFINVLNKIRSGILSKEDLHSLNLQINPVAEVPDYSVILTGYNRRAEQINSERLNSIESEEFIYHGEIVGDFSKCECPVPEILKLKKGAQVMFCRNNCHPNCANGTIGKVTELGEDSITVILENGEEVKVEKTIWQNLEKVYNKETKKLECQSTGSYTQFPLRLAWAITIHRSQGMTFKRMHLDLSWGIFATGQAYVAISRMQSLDGLTLSNEIMPHHIRQNYEVKALSNSFNDYDSITEEIRTGEIISTSLKNKNYDCAVTKLLDIVIEKINGNEFRNAALVAKQMFDIMLDDEILYGKTENITLINGSNLTSNFLNSLLCLYSKRFEEALGYTDLVLARKKCFEALFIKAKALFKLGNFLEASQVIFEIITLSNNDIDKRAIDKKLLLLEAKVNEKLGNPNIELCKKLLKICPEYINAYGFIRNSYEIEKLSISEDEISNPIIDAFINKEVNNDEFIDILKTIDRQSSEYKEFKDFISNIPKKAIQGC